MPTYDYECKSCHHRWDVFHSIKAEPLKDCPSCGKPTANRMIGTGAAVLFKGSGFYQTDYRSDSYKQAAKADQTSSAPAKTESCPTGPSSGGSSDTKSTSAKASD